MDLPEKLKRPLRRLVAPFRELRRIPETRKRIEEIEVSPTGLPRLVFQVEFFDRGGLEEVVFSLIRHFHATREYDVCVFVSHGEPGLMSSKTEELGVMVYFLRADTKYHHALVERLNPAIVNMQYSVFGASLYLVRNIKTVYSIQNNYIWADAKFIAERKPLYERFDRITACAQQVKEFFCERFDITPEAVKVVNNGIDLDFTQNSSPAHRSDCGFGDDDFLYVDVAAFNWHKFHILMIVAMERLVHTRPNFKMAFVANVADEQAAAYARDQIEIRGLNGNIKIVDYVPRAQLGEFLRMCDCYVMPSLVEGWSMAVMEAMAAELPLILSDVGAARDLIVDEDIGIVIPNPYPSLQAFDYSQFASLYHNDQHLGNLDALCGAMTRIYDDQKAWKEKAKLGRVKVEEEYTAAHMAENYARIFREI